MKVAYLINQYPKVSHAFIRREIRALEQLGHEVERYSVREPPERLVDELDVAEQARTRFILNEGARGLLSGLLGSALRRPRRFGRAARLAARMGWNSDRGLLRHAAYLAEACILVDWLQEAGTEHLHAHFGTNSTAVAALCHELGGPSFSFTAHGPEEFDKPRALALTEKIRRAKLIFGVSSFGRSQLYRQCAASDWRKIHVVRCGVDEKFVESEPPEVPETRRLVCVGRLCEQKGQLLLVRAAKLLMDQGQDFELTLVGDGELRAEIEAFIADAGLAGRVSITGWASSEQVRDHLLGARALVLPSFAEGLPVVIMEAMASARPVLTTYIAGIPELVQDGTTGWLVPAGSMGALVGGLRRVLNTPIDQVRLLGQQARKRVLEEHDMQVIAPRLAELFRNGQG